MKSLRLTNDTIIEDILLTDKSVDKKMLNEMNLNELALYRKNLKPKGPFSDIIEEIYPDMNSNVIIDLLSRELIAKRMISSSLGVSFKELSDYLEIESRTLLDLEYAEIEDEETYLININKIEKLNRTLGGN